MKYRCICHTGLGRIETSLISRFCIVLVNRTAVRNLLLLDNRRTGYSAQTTLRLESRTTSALSDLIIIHVHDANLVSLRRITYLYTTRMTLCDDMHSLSCLQCYFNSVIGYGTFCISAVKFMSAIDYIFYVSTVIIHCAHTCIMYRSTQDRL